MSEIAAIGSGVTGDLVLRALDAAVLRHTAYATNIANASTEDYRQLSVSFEGQLAAARSGLLDRNDATARRALESLRPQVEVQSTATKVRLDEQMSLMMQNTLRYEALVTALSKTGAVLRLAVREGRN